MLEVDLHVHSLFSCCGLHTILELVDRARTLGMKGIAITDHGLTMGGRLSSTFFDRFKSPYPDFIVYKGVECNLLDNGNIDVPVEYLPFLDIVLLGIHPNTPKGLSEDAYTDMLILAVEKNPCVDIITHPNDTVYPLNYSRLCSFASSKGVALELNNSRILYSRSTIDDTLELLENCKKSCCRVAVASDTHAILELGDDSSVSPLIEKVDFPKELLVTVNVLSAGCFIEERKRYKVV